MSSVPGGKMDLVVIGCPHLTLEGLIDLANRIKGREVKVETYVLTNKVSKEMARQMGVAQIIENPHDASNLVILYAGLSEKSTLQVCDSYLYDRDASFAIFNGDTLLQTGDWNPQGELVWTFSQPESW